MKTTDSVDTYHQKIREREKESERKRERERGRKSERVRERERKREGKSKLGKVEWTKVFCESVCERDLI